MGTLNPLVAGSSPAPVTLRDRKAAVVYRQVTLVTWAFAPEWLTVEEASRLSGHSVSTIVWLAREGAIDIADDTELLIEKESLREFQESLLEIA